MAMCIGYLPVNYAQVWMHTLRVDMSSVLLPDWLNNLQKALNSRVLSFNYVLMFLLCLCNWKPKLTALVLKKNVQVIDESTITAHGQVLVWTHYQSPWTVYDKHVQPSSSLEISRFWSPFLLWHVEMEILQLTLNIIPIQLTQ